MSEKKSPVLFRSVALEVTRADEQSEPVIRAALSSESPVERHGWFDGNWIEILEHSKDAVNLSRAKNGLPLLVEHETREQVGRITDIKIDNDRTLRGTLTFSRSARAQEIKQDVLDGIRQEMSIGYQITKVRKTEKQNAPTEVRALEWTPLEGSLVAVPADATVGVGRSLELTVDTQETRTMSDAPKTPETKTATVEVQPDAGAVERKRVSELRALARAHKITDAKFDEWMEKGTSAEAATREVLTGYEASVRPGFLGRSADAPAVTSEDLEKGRYSLSRALLAMTDPATARQTAPFEMEVHDAIIAKRGQPTKGGLYIPVNMWVKPEAAQKVREQVYYQRGAHEVATASKGGELKFTEPGAFIELLRNRIFTRSLGARFLTGLQGDIQFPRQTGAHSVSWVGESPTADVSESNMTLDNLNLAPKLATATTSYTRKLLAQGVVDIDNLIRDDFVQVFAIELDRVGLNGLGTSNQPRGILNTSGIGDVAGGTNGAAPTYDHLVDLEREVAVDNADLGNLAYMTEPKARAKLKKVAQISATTGIPVWFNGEVNGYPAFATNQVPSNLTKGTSTTICSAIIFGNWQELIYGQWGDMEVVVDPYTQARRGNILITPYLMVDVGVRHAVSFAAMKDALA